MVTGCPVHGTLFSPALRALTLILVGRGYTLHMCFHCWPSCLFEEAEKKKITHWGADEDENPLLFTHSLKVGDAADGLWVKDVRKIKNDLILKFPTFPASVEVKIRLELLPPVMTVEHEALPSSPDGNCCERSPSPSAQVYMYSGDNDMLSKVWRELQSDVWDLVRALAFCMQLDASFSIPPLINKWWRAFLCSKLATCHMMLLPPHNSQDQTGEFWVPPGDWLLMHIRESFTATYSVSIYRVVNIFLYRMLAWAFKHEAN